MENINESTANLVAKPSEVKGKLVTDPQQAFLTRLVNNGGKQWKMKVTEQDLLQGNKKQIINKWFCVIY